MFTQYNEPWVKDPKSRTLFDCTGGVVAAFESHADAGRAATCVNAMDGIEDPGGFVHEAKQGGSCDAPQCPKDDHQKWIAGTFRRVDHINVVSGWSEPQLQIMPIGNATILTESQLRDLIQYLKARFCGACDGTGFDPDTLEGRCEYCTGMPF